MNILYSTFVQYGAFNKCTSLMEMDYFASLTLSFIEKDNDIVD